MAYGAFHTLKINRFKILADLSNFPVYVDITDPTLKDVAHGGSVTSSSGYDIGFSSDSAGTSLYKWEVEAYDPVTGRIRAHVKVPAVSSSSHTVFYLPYGDAGITTDQSDPVNVWTNSFISVYHMKDGTTLSVLDSLNVNNGTNHGATASPSGQIDGCGGFASVSSQYIDLGTGINPTALTYSAWVNATTFPGTYNAVLNRSNVGYTIYTMFNVKNTGKLTCYASGTGTTNYDGTGTYTLTAGIWYHIAMTYDSTGGLKGYVNGALDGSSAAVGALNTTALNTYIGVEINTASRLWNGLIDEARISSVARPVEWLLAEYSNQFSPLTFIYVDTDPPAARDLIGQTDGYYSVADLDDTTPQPDQANSGAATENPANLRPFIWPVLGIAPGIVHDVGATQKVFIKRFEADTDPTLSLSGALTAVAFMLVAALTFAANLLLSAQFLTRRGVSMTAIAAFHGVMLRQTNALRFGTLSFSTAVTRSRLLIITAVLSFVGSIKKGFIRTINAAISFVGVMFTPRAYQLLFQATLRFLGYRLQSGERIQVNALTSVVSFLHNVIGECIFSKNVPKVIPNQQTIYPYVSEIWLGDLSAHRLPVLFIKNIDHATSVEIDVSAGFDKCPQLLTPQSGILLSPDAGFTLYARTTSSLTADIQVIFGG